MRKTYTILTNWTITNKNNTFKMFNTIETKERLNKRELEEFLDFLRSRGREFIVGKKQITIMSHMIIG